MRFRSVTSISATAWTSSAGLLEPFGALSLARRRELIVYPCRLFYCWRDYLASVKQLAETENAPYGPQ